MYRRLCIRCGSALPPPRPIRRQRILTDIEEREARGDLPTYEAMLEQLATTGTTDIRLIDANRETERDLWWKNRIDGRLGAP